MVDQDLNLRSIDEIRSYVSATLCEINSLNAEQYELTEQVFSRNGKPCGLYFCINGPRQVSLTAIWETDNNSILFYGCSGQRVGRTQLIDGPTLDPSDLPEETKG